MTSFSLSFLDAEEENRSSLYYMKLGAVFPPGDSAYVLPVYGIGTRFQRSYYGIDLSANVATTGSINYLSLKGLFLFYPHPEKKNQFYLGIGPGIGYYTTAGLIDPYASRSHECTMATLEGVIGYELRHSQRFKTFVQLEPSQPVFQLTDDHPCRYKPGVALTFGIGF